jgi:hypothetical protein
MRPVVVPAARGLAALRFEAEQGTRFYYQDEHRH